MVYFYFNKLTMEKINLIENKTGINLNYFRNKLKDSQKKYFLN